MPPTKAPARSRLLRGPATQRFHPGIVRSRRIDVLYVVQIRHLDSGDRLGMPLDQVAAAEIEPALE
jgi:hypothetical protein